jgi:hypothetical protein
LRPRSFVYLYMEKAKFVITIDRPVYRGPISRPAGLKSGPVPVPSLTCETNLFMSRSRSENLSGLSHRTRARWAQHFLDPDPHLDYTLNIFKKYFFKFAPGNRSGNMNFFFSADLYRYLRA